MREAGSSAVAIRAARGAGIASGQIGEDVQPFLLDGLKTMARNLVNTLKGLAVVMIEKAWNALVNTLWSVIDSSDGAGQGHLGRGILHGHAVRCEIDVILAATEGLVGITIPEVGIKDLLREGKRAADGLAGEGCGFSISKIPGGRSFELAEAESFLRDKRIGPLEGFRSKAGWPFSAELRLVYDDEISNWKLEFDFGDEAKREAESGEPVDVGASVDAAVVGERDGLDGGTSCERERAQGCVVQA